jgi:ABC-2 type transport system ATP-binding protein
VSAVVETIGLTKKYGRRVALQDCTLTIPAGTVVGLVGPNGPGGRRAAQPHGHVVASPLDRAAMSLFETFDQRDIAPVGYAACAFAIGVTAGIVIRRGHA